MRRAVLIAALAAFGVVFAASRPDVVVKPNAIYARRGSLGANDFVATNVARWLHWIAVLELGEHAGNPRPRHAPRLTKCRIAALAFAARQLK